MRDRTWAERASLDEPRTMSQCRISTEQTVDEEPCTSGRLLTDRVPSQLVEVETVDCTSVLVRLEAESPLKRIGVLHSISESADSQSATPSARGPTKARAGTANPLRGPSPPPLDGWQPGQGSGPRPCGLVGLWFGGAP